MCIVLISTAHPDYALILINNRDEFLNRPTAHAHWWEPPNQHVLGGRDLLRKEQGTWLGITKQGRVAVLTNFREEGAITPDARSRGAMVNAFLTEPADSLESTESFAANLVRDNRSKGVGGFSLVCGKLGQPLAVISNRTPDPGDITWIAGERNETIGLSNAVISNRTWPKVLRGEELLTSAIKSSIANRASEARFIDDLFRVLSDDTLPKKSKDTDFDTYVRQLRKSIFIPMVNGEGADMSAQDLAAAQSDRHVNVQHAPREGGQSLGQSGAYGTQKQTVVLVDHHGKVTFVERTLYDSTGKVVVEADQDSVFRFEIESWQGDIGEELTL